MMCTVSSTCIYVPDSLAVSDSVLTPYLTVNCFSEWKLELLYWVLLSTNVLGHLL